MTDATEDDRMHYFHPRYPGTPTRIAIGDMVSVDDDPESDAVIGTVADIDPDSIGVIADGIAYPQCAIEHVKLLASDEIRGELWAGIDLRQYVELPELEDDDRAINVVAYAVLATFASMIGGIALAIYLINRLT